MQQKIQTVEDLPFMPVHSDMPSHIGEIVSAGYAKYGPIFRSRTVFDDMDVVYLVGPEANRFVLSTNRLKFSHHQGWGHAFGVIGMFGNGLLTMDGAEHDEHRRMMNPAFAISYLDRYLPIMSRLIRERSAEWLKKGTVDIYEESRRITFDIAAEALVGLKSGPEVDRFREIFVQMLMLGMMSVSQEDYDTNLTRLKKELYSLLQPKIEERRQHPTDDVLGMLVQARDDEGRALSDEQLIAHTNILLVAGHETSTSLSSWLLYLLVENPDYLQRVLDEQDSLLGKDEEPTLDTIKRMKVLDNALSEAERLYPPVASGPRGVVEDFEFNGYHVPAGTFVFYSIAASHLLPDIFKDPTKFDPDRFAAPREEDKKTPYALVGFGGGPRICIGINFAQVEIKAMVAHILRHYRLELVPNQEIIQYYRGTGMPLNGIKMHVSARK
ncbi:MAG: cytochrome P450 [Chloroflexota bacterium]